MNSLKFLVLFATSLCTEKTTKKNEKRFESKSSFNNRSRTAGIFIFAFLLLLCFIYPSFGLQENSDNNNASLYQPSEEHGENSIEKTRATRLTGFDKGEIILGHFYREHLKNFLADYSYLYQEYGPLEILENLKKSSPGIFDDLNIYNYDDKGSSFIIETPNDKKFIFIQSIGYGQERIDSYNANQQILNELKICRNVDMLQFYMKSTDVTFTWTIVEIPEASIIETARQDVNEEVLNTIVSSYRIRAQYLLEKGYNPGLISRWQEVLFISRDPEGGIVLFNEEPIPTEKHNPEDIFTNVIENMLALAYNWKLLGSGNPRKFKTFEEIKKEDYAIIQDRTLSRLVSTYYDALNDKKRLRGLNRNGLLSIFRKNNDENKLKYGIHYDYIFPQNRASFKRVFNLKNAYHM